MRSPFARSHYDVAGRTVFVTGAARGIGAAAATRLHAAGANVALVGLEPELLEQLAARLGDRAAAFDADVTDIGARVGCAYFGFVDTDLVRGSFAHPSTRVMTAALPSFVSTPAPLSAAVDAIEHAVQRRAARVWAPRWVGGALVLRGVLQPLIELRMRYSRDLPRALALVDPERGDLRDQHSALGVGGDAAGVQPPERAAGPP